MCHLHLKLCTPAGAAVLRIPAVFLGVLAFEIDQQAERRRAHNAHQPVKRGKAGGKVGKGRTDGPSQPQQLFPEARARRQTVRLPQLAEQIDKQQIIDFSLLDISLFNCVGFPNVGFSCVGLSNIGFSNVGESGTGWGCS